MTRRLRWGILGVARINDRFIPAAGMAANAELRALASRDMERARGAAARARIPTAYGSYEALLDDPTLDAVYIPLPNSLHAEWTRKAADRGKHVLCEKPLAPTAAEAQRMIDYCKSRNVCLMDGFMWPHHPRTGYLRRLLDRGTIGAPKYVTSTFTVPMTPLEPSNIRLRAELGGGSLLDVGCYCVLATCWAFGAGPSRVYATAEYKHGVDVAVQALLWFADGRRASFDCGFTLPFRRWLEITGTEGVLFIPDMWLPSQRATIEIRQLGKPAEEFVLEGHDQVVCMIEDFGRAVLNREPIHPPVEEAVRTLRVLEALATSAREGRVVEVASS